MFLLETPRLVLREFTMDDLDDLAEVRSGPEVMRFVGPGEARARPRQDSRDLIEWIVGRYVADGYGLWAVTSPGENGGRSMGFCGLLNQNVEGRPELEIAYTLGRPFWGKGFATRGGDRRSRSCGWGSGPEPPDLPDLSGEHRVDPRGGQGGHDARAGRPVHGEPGRPVRLRDFDMMGAEVFARQDLGKGIAAVRERRPPRFEGR